MRRTVEKDNLQPQHVVARDPVSEAVRPAGVGRHIPADRADRTARGIGRIAQPAWLQRLIELPQIHPALDLAPEPVLRNLTDRPELRRVNDGASLRRHRAAGQRRASTAQADRHAGAVQHPHHLRQLVGIRGDDHQIRPEGFVAQAIRLIARHLRGRSHHPAPRSGTMQGRHNGAGGRSHPLPHRRQLMLGQYKQSPFLSFFQNSG